MQDKLKYANTAPLSSILVEDRLRRDMGEVAELAESIRDNGLLHPPVVEKLASNSEFSYRLLAGGRRMAALTLLKFDNVPITVFDELTPDQRIIVEVEENIRRKDMTWVEELEGIVKFHKAKSRASALDGEKWTQSMTGKLLNMEQAQVSTALKVYDAIKAGNERVKQATNMFEAVKILFQERLDEGQKEQLRRIQLKRAEQAAAVSNQGTTLASKPILESVLLKNETNKSKNPTSGKVLLTPESVASFYHHGSALELLPLLAKNTVINHIITDPPYGIDMVNLDEASFPGVSRIAETHQVEPNLRLIKDFIDISFDCIAEDGFMCMWYDLDHHEKIKEWAEKRGWKVCRWPFLWLKTTPCRNSQAQYNITKASETCYLFRRSEKSILKQKRSNNYLLAGSVATNEHPFVKPHEIWKWLIEAVSLEGQTIFDGFAGQGSCLSASFKLSRDPIGVEIDEKHIASGLNYICEQVNQKSILDDVLMPPL